MATARYDRVIAQMGQWLGGGVGRGLDTTRRDQWLNQGINYLCGLKQWNWRNVHIESGAANESLGIRDADDALASYIPLAPRYDGFWTVKTRVSDTGDWFPCRKFSWQQISQRTDDFNRTATTTAAQKFWAFKYDHNATATKVPVLTIETFPYSYATSILYYQIDYQAQSPRVAEGAAGANADDAFIWPDDDLDYIVALYAAMYGAMEIDQGDNTRYLRVQNQLQIEMDSAFRESLPAQRIELPKSLAIMQGGPE